VVGAECGGWGLRKHIRAHLLQVLPVKLHEHCKIN